jgi:Tfp pilus assembly protein PilO
MDTKDLKILSAPLLFFIALAFLSTLLYKFAYPKVKAEYADFKIAQKNENILKEKEALLKEVADEVPTEVNFLSTALPDKNTGLLLISQLKSLAQARSFTVEDIKIGTEAIDGQLFSTTLSFSVGGDSAGLLDLAVNTTTISPLVLIKSIKISRGAGTLEADISGSAYWSRFPTVLPALADPLKRYSKDDRDLMVKISALTPPTFIEVTPQAVPQKADPFAY